MLSPLPLGTSDFSVLRESGEIYVDKTDLIYQLAQNRGNIFLARPRRFGKSLLLSTFESLFKEGIKHFGGLAIEKPWNDKTYDVVRLDFSEVKDFSDADDFKKKFHSRLALIFGSVGFQDIPDNPDKIGLLSLWLSSLEPRSLVILIDEYDAPLTQCLNKPELFQEIRSVMSEFFSTLKSNDRCQRFFFMTGITKFSNTSIFSAFNNLEDISLIPRYGTLLGYTDSEIRHYFGGHIKNAAQLLGITEEALLANLKENYDGFSFDKKAENRVYCPWSILSFLKEPDGDFPNYWYSSGGQPSVLQNFLVNHALANPLSFGETREIDLSELNADNQYDGIDLDVLLTQAGYYTIREILPGGWARLGYPNREVSVSMARLYARELLQKKPIPFAAPILELLETNNVQDVVDYFNAAVGAIDYQNYPIQNEASCRAYLQILLIGAALLPKVEVHNAFGRSDLEVETQPRHWIFEFRFVQKNTEAPAKLAEAAAQMHNRHYNETQAVTKTLKRVALIFSAESRSFCCWKEVA